MSYEEQFYKDLLTAGIVYISGEINEKTVEAVNRAVTWLEASGKEGTFYFDSRRGGSVAAALDCYDRIRSSSVRIAGIVTGSAFSAAAVIFLACHVRKMQQSSQIMIHDFYPGETAEQKEVVDRAISAQNDLLRRILIDRTDLALSEIEELCDGARVLSAHEAREMTVIDEIIVTIP